MLKTFPPGNSLVVQGLRLSTFTATGPGFTLDWGNKIPQDVKPKKKKKKSPPDHQIITDNRSLWLHKPGLLTQSWFPPRGPGPLTLAPFANRLPVSLTGFQLHLLIHEISCTSFCYKCSAELGSHKYDV